MKFLFLIALMAFMPSLSFAGETYDFGFGCEPFLLMDDEDLSKLSPSLRQALFKADDHATFSFYVTLYAGLDQTTIKDTVESLRVFGVEVQFIDGIILGARATKKDLARALGIKTIQKFTSAGKKQP